MSFVPSWLNLLAPAGTGVRFENLRRTISALLGQLPDTECNSEQLRWLTWADSGLSMWQEKVAIFPASPAALKSAGAILENNHESTANEKTRSSS